VKAQVKVNATAKVPADEATEEDESQASLGE
jgi:hypothetical protein